MTLRSAAPLSFVLFGTWRTDVRVVASRWRARCLAGCWSLAEGSAQLKDAVVETYVPGDNLLSLAGAEQSHRAASERGPGEFSPGTPAELAQSYHDELLELVGQGEVRPELARQIHDDLFEPAKRGKAPMLRSSVWRQHLSELDGQLEINRNRRQWARRLFTGRLKGLSSPPNRG